MGDGLGDPRLAGCLERIGFPGCCLLRKSGLFLFVGFRCASGGALSHLWLLSIRDGCSGCAAVGWRCAFSVFLLTRPPFHYGSRSGLGAHPPARLLAGNTRIVLTVLSECRCVGVGK